MSKASATLNTEPLIAVQPATPLTAKRTDAERPRLNQRMLMVSAVVPPTPYADAFVVKGLLSQFAPDEVVLASERTWANPPHQTQSNGHRVHFIGNRWNWPKRGQRYFYWLRWLSVPRTARRLIKLAREENCGLIFAHYPDDHLLFAAYLAARRLQVPFFSFFHNTYRENRSGLSRLLANCLQPLILRQSKLTFVMSEGMKTELEAIYPGRRFQPLVHTFSEELPQFQPLTPIDPLRIRIGYLGNVNDSNLDALCRFGSLVNQSPDLHLTIYSSAPAWFIQKHGLAGPRIRHEQPSDEELLGRLRSNDILFLPLGLAGGLAPIEYRTIFPTRTIPYLLSGRPILAHSPTHSFLTNWLIRHGCADLVAEPDPGALRVAIDRLVDDCGRRERLVRNALLAAEQFRAHVVVDEMKRTINRCLDGNGECSHSAELH